MQKTIVIASMLRVKQGRGNRPETMDERLAWVSFWCDCFALLAMTTDLRKF
jgi:hypothetical protein